MVTAVLEGGTPVMLRSYRARREHSVARDCSIWQAGRATCATGLAFKPITIGRWTFTDKGNGKFNPSLQLLDEAESEGRGRTVGAFLSIGTGKLPRDINRTSHEWYEGIAGGIDRFAEARRRLLSKIEDCETTHQEFLRTIKERGIPEENYLRLNPDNGVGEFGMNEWSRLRQINNMTEAYARQVETQMQRLADKMAGIGDIEAEVFSHQDPIHPSFEQASNVASSRTDSRPSTMASSNAVELPAMDLPPIPSGRFSTYGPQYPMYPFHENTTPQDKFTIVSSDEPSPPGYTNGDVSKAKVSSDERPPRQSSELPGNNVNLPAKPSTPNNTPMPGLPSRNAEQNEQSRLPPPLPPKTPIQTTGRPGQKETSSPRQHGPLPYPDDDGPPPVVNMARKPELLKR